MNSETRDLVREGCKRSAAAVLPFVFAHVGTPDVILDVGCGEGHWMREALNLGVQYAAGLDTEVLGDGAYQWNAESGEPIIQKAAGHKGGVFPLTFCLEMAEHVSPEAGEHLVAELCRVSAYVLWSAAIPGQGGDGHVNEQWPAYWDARFHRHGWCLSDPFRDDLWMDARVEPWYRQNLLLSSPMEETGWEIVRPLIDPVTWAYHRGVNPPDTE